MTAATEKIKQIVLVAEFLGLSSRDSWIAILVSVTSALF